MSAELTQTLADIGLSEKAARLYLAALASGPATAQQLSKSSGLKRTTIYPVIESLVAKGLMSVTMRGVKRRFVPESPARLEALIELRHRRLKDSLGELSALYNLQPGESSIKFYEGVDSLRTVYNGLIDDAERGKDYLVVSSVDDWYKLDPKFFQEFIDRRSGMGFKIRYLLRAGKVAERIAAAEALHGHKTKFLPQTTGVRANVVIIPKRVVINQVIPPVWAAVIENQAIVQTFHEFFNMIWQSLPTLPLKQTRAKD